MNVDNGVIRTVTDDEVVVFRENGWVKLDGLVDRGLIGELLGSAEEIKARAEASFAREPTLWQKKGEIVHRDFGEWSAAFLQPGPWFGTGGVQTEPFRSFTYSQALGRVMHRLFDRKRLTDTEVGVRYCRNSIPCRPPYFGEDWDEGYHQDLDFGTDNATDRSGGATIWIALDEVLPEQGAMRFLTGSHREGALGGDHEHGLLGTYPKLVDLYDWSPPFHYQPGDATVHDSRTIHGGPANRTDKPRWSYIASYVSADNQVITSDKLTSAGEERPIVYP